MKKLKIDRNRWWRGQGPEGSALRRPENGKMCCLGLYLEACGVDLEALTNKSYPTAFGLYPLPEETEWLLATGDRHDQFSVSSDDATTLACTNDDRSFEEIEREEKIRAVFAKNGISVEFFGDQRMETAVVEKKGTE